MPSTYSTTQVNIGAMSPYAGATAPAGYLLCDGSILPNGVGTVQGVTADFSALYALVGTTYGSAGQLPDTRNVFLRGANASTRAITFPVIGSVTYPAVARGTTTNDKMQGHNHYYKQTALSAQGTYAGNGTPTGSNATGVIGDPIADANSNGTPRTGAETAPVNLGVNFIIKY